MSAPKDGGPAFPNLPVKAPAYDRGMSLRDYFAAKAMQGAASDTGWNFESPQHAAFWAYKIADAMLVERAKATGA